jgi:uncharacterized protein YjbJ (UPF0337 family)
MEKEEIQGKVEKAKGYVKEKAGQITNDPELEAEGAADRAEGAVREGYGEIKDKAKKVAEDISE